MGRHSAPDHTTDRQRAGSSHTARHSGYPTDAERARHFGPGGPHRTGKCGPVCTFGDY
jgi:hypothetical protein